MQLFNIMLGNFFNLLFKRRFLDNDFIIEGAFEIGLTICDKDEN